MKLNYPGGGADIHTLENISFKSSEFMGGGKPVHPLHTIILSTPLCLLPVSSLICKDNAGCGRPLIVCKNFASGRDNRTKWIPMVASFDTTITAAAAAAERAEICNIKIKTTMKEKVKFC